ncbi:hypothetical protein [Streptomyces sp. NPDC001205]
MSQWKHLLEVMPDRYAYAEAQEEVLRRLLGPVTILRQRRKGVAHPLPLIELRRAHEATPMLPGEQPLTAVDSDGTTVEVS